MPLKSPKPVPVETKVPKHEGSRPFQAEDLQFSVRFRGIFDFQGLYNMMVHWLMKYNFYFHETTHKHKPPEIEIEWLAIRKKTGFVQENITIHIHAFVEDVEVIEDSEKKKMSKGRITITFNGSVETAYPDIFEEKQFNTVLQRKLLKFYNNVIMKRELDFFYDDVLYYEIYNFQTAVKDYLNIYARGNAY